MGPTVAVRCVRCYGDRHLSPFETLCAPCILALAGEANTAYDAVRDRRGSPHPKRERDRLVSEVLLWIESNHGDHQVPHVGCAFCVLPS